MFRRQIATGIFSLFVAATTYGANPFLDSTNDKPVSAQFRGTEWGEDLADDSPFSLDRVAPPAGAAA